jgi:hypothetical protein
MIGNFPVRNAGRGLEEEKTPNFALSVVLNWSLLYSPFAQDAVVTLIRMIRAIGVLVVGESRLCFLLFHLTESPGRRKISKRVLFFTSRILQHQFLSQIRVLPSSNSLGGSSWLL